MLVKNVLLYDIIVVYSLFIEDSTIDFKVKKCTYVLYKEYTHARTHTHTHTQPHFKIIQKFSINMMSLFYVMVSVCEFVVVHQSFTSVPFFVCLIQYIDSSSPRMNYIQISVVSTCVSFSLTFIRINEFFRI